MGFKSTICAYFNGGERRNRTVRDSYQGGSSSKKTSGQYTTSPPSSYFDEGEKNADLNSKKRIDKQKMNEISKRTGSNFLGRETDQHAQAKLDESTGWYVQSVTEQVCKKNNAIDLNVPWAQRPRSSSYHVQQQTNFSQSTQTKPHSSKIPVSNQRQSRATQTKNITYKNDHTEVRSIPCQSQTGCSINEFTIPQSQVNYEDKCNSSRDERNVPRARQHISVQIDRYQPTSKDQYKEKFNTGRDQEKLLMTSENYYQSGTVGIKNYSSQYETQGKNPNNSIQIKNSRGTSEDIPTVACNMRTVTEIESGLQNLGATYSQQKSGTSKVSSRDQEEEMGLDPAKSIVNPGILETNWETNLVKQHANHPIIPIQMPTHTYLEDEQKVTPGLEKHTERNTSIKNEEKSNYSGNHQRQYTNKKMLPYPQTDQIQVGTEISEGWTTHDEGNEKKETQDLDTMERDANERNFSEKLDDSDVLEKINEIKSKSLLFHPYITHFKGDSSAYYYIDENLTRFLLKLDKLPVEHSSLLKRERRAAIKFIYDLQNMLEENLRKQRKIGPMVVSQI